MVFFIEKISKKAVSFYQKNVEFMKLYEVINKFLKFINKVDIIFIF